MTDTKVISTLLLKQFSETLTSEEQAILDNWLLQSLTNRAFYDKINDDDELRKLILSFRSGARQTSEEKILKQLLPKISNRQSATKGKVRRFTGLLVAASVIAIVGTGIYLNSVFKTQKTQSPVAVQTPGAIAAPATNRAMITLADGSKVYLDSVSNGQLAQLGSVKLVKLANGQIAYQTTTGEILKELQYNVLTNPKGSKVIDIQLSDGSHVWLNAGSSITYPVAFMGNERKVELKGEGYFEVAKDPVKKFIVTANGITTEVLGTHFNVNAYRDEKEVKVTLLEGKVKVFTQQSEASKQQSRVLQPGQQAVYNARTYQLTSGNTADLSQVLAWKEGFFSFRKAGLPEVMRQLSRWYDVDIQYEQAIPRREFTGDIDCSLTLEQVLEALTQNRVKYKREGDNRIIILP